MKINYKILWFENESLWLKSKVQKIKDIVEKENFDFELDKYRKEGEFIGDYNDYDFILIDFKLGDNSSGTNIINKLRSGDCYVDVLFYSQEGETKLKEEIGNTGLQGVFYCSREDFLDEFNKIFEKSLKKVQHPNNLRGLVMAETSDLEKLKNKILKKYFSLSHNKRDELEKNIHEKIENFVEDNLSKINSYRKEKFLLNKESSMTNAERTINDLIDERFFDFAKKARTIENLIAFLNLSINFNFENYNTEVIIKRNKLAHEPEEERDGKVYFKDLCFTHDECRLIRKDIRKYRSLLEGILKTIEDTITPTIVSPSSS